MTHVKSAVIVLILSMLFSVILTYAGMVTILQTARDNTTLALDSFVTHNSIQIYDSLKQGNEETDSLEENIFENEIFSLFSLDIQGDTLYSVDEKGNMSYFMTIPNVDFAYANTLKLSASYIVTIPVRFAGKEITELQIPQAVTAYYNLKQR